MKATTYNTNTLNKAIMNKSLLQIKRNLLMVSVLAISLIGSSTNVQAQTIVETFENFTIANSTGFTVAQAATATTSAISITTFSGNNSSATAAATTSGNISTGTWSWYGSKASIVPAGTGNSGYRIHSATKGIALVHSSYLITPTITSGITQITMWVAGTGACTVGYQYQTNTTVNLPAYAAVTGGTASTSLGYVGVSSTATVPVSNATIYPTQLTLAINQTNPGRIIFWTTSSNVIIDDIVITSPASGCSAPTNAPTGSDAFTGTTSTSTTWGTITKGADADGTIIFCKATSSTADDPADLTDYTASTTFASGTQIGATGWYCVYKGTDANPSVTVTGLTAGTAYYFKAYSYDCTTTSVKFNMTEKANNTTTCADPTVQASGSTFSSVAGTSFTWTITSKGNGDNVIVLCHEGAAVDSDPVDLSTYATASTDWNSKGTQIGTGNYVVYKGSAAAPAISMTNLLVGTTYHFKAYAYNDCSSAPKYLTTSPLTDSQATSCTEPTTQPTSGAGFSSVNSTGMTWGITKANTGDNTVILCHEGANVDSDPVDGADYTASTNWSAKGTQIGTGNYVVYVGSGASPSVVMTNLSASTTYYYKAYSFNDCPATTPNYYTTTPLSGNQATSASCAAPSGQPTGSPAFSGTTVSATTWGTLTKAASADNTIIFCRASSVGGNENPVDGTTYTANLAMGSGTEITGSTGWFCVYNGTGNPSITVTGLSSGTAYYFKAYAYNACSGSPMHYTTSPITGNTTTLTPPTASTQAVSSIATTTATGNATITLVGDGVTTSGLCWKTSTGPTTADSKTTDGATTATTYTGSMTSLTANTLYYVKAYATGSSVTNYGAEVQATTLSLAPTVAAESNVTSVGFSANWTAPGAQGAATYTYTVEVTNTSGDYSGAELIATYANIASGTLTKAVSGLNPSTNYWYRVKVVNAGGSSAYTAEEAVTTSSAGVSQSVFNWDTDYTHATYDAGPTGYVQTGLATYYKATTGGSQSLGTYDCNTYNVSCPTSGNLFIIKFDVDVDSIRIRGKGTGSNRTFSSVTSSATLNGTYSAFTASGIGTMESSSNCDSISVEPTTNFVAGTFYKVTLSGNVNITSIICYLTPSGTPPTVTTQAVSSIATTTATGNGTITDVGTSCTQSGICWNTSTGPTVSNSKTTDGPTTAQAYTGSMTSLTANTLYYVKAYALGTAGTSYGSEVQATTLSLAPTVATESSVASTSFSANWTAPGAQGAATYTYTVEVTNTSGDYSGAELIATYSDIASGTLTQAVSGLTASTNYWYRVKVVNAGGSSAYSAEEAVTTSATSATVTTQAVSSIATTTATGNGTITNHNGTTVNQHGVCYATTAGVDINDTKTTEGATGSTSPYTSSITGLTANTLYYITAYASSTNGATGYGSETTFTTLSLAPTVAAETTITSGGFTANWTAPGAQGSATYTYSVEVTATSGDYTTKAAEYTGIASGTLTRVVTGLNPATNYWYRVKVVNAGGSSAYSAQEAVTTGSDRTLTVTFDPVAGGTVTGDGASLTSGVGVEKSLNDVVTLAATPASGYGFLRWVINGSQISSTPYDLTMDENKTVTAKFAAITEEIFNFDDSKADYATYNATTTGYEMTGIGTYFKSTAGGTISTGTADCDGYTDSRVTSSSIFYFKTDVDITSLTVRGTGTGTNRTFSSLATCSTLGGTYTADGSASATGSIANPSSGTCGSIAITPSATITANTYIKLTFSGNINVTSILLYSAPDGSAPSLTFSPANSETAVLLNTNLTITSNEALYRYYPSTDAYVELTTAALAGMSDDSVNQFIWLTDAVSGDTIAAAYSIDATGKIITVNPDADFADYSHQYRLSIKNVADINDNVITGSQYAQFTTRPTPAPEIKIELVSTNTDIADDGSVNMGTSIGGGTIDKTFRIINTAVLDNLTIDACSFTSGGSYFAINGANPTTLDPVVADDTIQFTVRFTPGAGAGTYTGVLSIENNDTNEDPFTINFSGGRANFVLPYKYESGLSTPIYSDDTLYQDITTVTDIPSQITRNGNGAIAEGTSYYDDYSVFQVEGNCATNGNSALRVGKNATSNNKGLEIDLANGCGLVTVKWCSNGYRKIKMSNGATIYEESPSFLPGGVCYTTSTVINNSSNFTLDIEFIAPDSTLLTTIYYLEITPYDPTLQSSAKNIMDFSTGVVGENVRIYNDAIFVSVPNGTNLTTITPSTISVSAFASVSPTQGAVQDFSSGAITYTVTAQNASTKTYEVFVEIEPTYTGTYKDTVEVEVAMGNPGTDQLVEVLEISNSSCVVPVTGNGGNYTIHYLDADDLPVGGYQIGGLSQVCIGSEVCYSLTNAPTTNNPSYSWKIYGDYVTQFGVVGADTTQTHGATDTLTVTQSIEELCLEAPNDTLAASLSITIQVEFDPNCDAVEGSTDFVVNVTEDAPTAVDALEASCVSNGMLTVTAKGAGASATTYGWSFYPSQSIVSQTDSTIVLNVGAGGADIGAEVVAQNGCGVTAATDTLDIDYATAETTWDGSTSTDWNNPDNWSGRVPTACTNVIIPDVTNSGSVNYPIISTTGICNYITFRNGGAVKGIQNLTYVKAFVELTVARDRYYTLTAPLKEMYSGDYFFNGAPESYMRLFDAVSPDAIGPNLLYEGKFTRSFATLQEALSPGEGFSFRVAQKTWDYPNGSTNDNTDKTITFPRMNLDSTLVTSYIPYSAYNGMPYTFITKTVTKDPTLAYRLALGNGTTSTMSDKTQALQSGYNLIGNPMMTHLDLNAFLNSNSGTISNWAKLWSNNSYKTYDGTSDTWDSGYTGDYLPPMQSFVVNAPSANNITFTLATHFTSDDNLSALRSAEATKPNTLFINAQKDGITTGIVLIKYDQALNNYDKADIPKLFTHETQVADIYSLADGYALSFNKFRSYPFTAPIGIKTTEYGAVKLDIKGADSFADADVYLVNSLTGEQVNLKENQDYRLTLTPENEQGSLFVEFRKAGAVTSDKTTINSNDDIQIFAKQNNTVRVISSTLNPIKEVTIFDEVGRVLVRNIGLNLSLYDTTLNNGTKVVFVKVVTERSVKYAKVLIN